MSGKKELKVGDRVGYIFHHLLTGRSGIITEINDGSLYCLVKWDRGWFGDSVITSKQYIPNLEYIPCP